MDAKNALFEDIVQHARILKYELYSIDKVCFTLYYLFGFLDSYLNFN